MQVPNGRQEVSDIPVLPVHVDLLEICLAETLGIGIVIRVGSVQQDGITVLHQLAGDDRAALIVLGEREFVDPLLGHPFANVARRVTVEFRRAANERSIATPPRRATADWNPPPTLTTSARNRKASRRFDFPDALGPTRNIRGRRAT